MTDRKGDGMPLYPQAVPVCSAKLSAVMQTALRVGEAQRYDAKREREWLRAIATHLAPPPPTR